MPIKEPLDSVEALGRWAYEHDGRIDVKWDQQDDLNIQNSRRFDAITKRLTAVEKRVIMFAAGAAALGSFASDAISMIRGLIR